MKTHHKISLLALAFVLPYIIGWAFPDDWWATHHLAFLPAPWNYLLFSSALIVLFLGLFIKSLPTKKLTFNHWSISLAFGIVVGFLCYQFPIASDNYGNARSFVPYLPQTVETLPDSFWAKLFSFELKPGNGRWGVFHFFTLIAYLFKTTYQDVFLWVNAVCGGLFVFTWLRFVAHNVQNTTWKLAISIAGVTSPFLLIFFGHIETYAPLYLILLWYLILLVKQLETKNHYLFIPLLILLLLGIRFHTLMYFLFPSLVLALINQWKGNAAWFQKLTTLKGLLLWLFIPVCIAGLILYFFILRDHNDPRFLDGDIPDIERLFLPIISPEAPLDKYNLQSWNHTFDFINAILHWSPALLFLIVACLVFYRKSLKQSLPLNILIYTLLLFASFLFMINPLLSMPMDWDLFVFPTPLIMVIALLLVRGAQNESVTSSIPLGALSIVLLAAPIFIVNAQPKAHSQRQDTVGVHVYKTYYAHSASLILEALNMLPMSTKHYMQRKQILIEKLEPLAQPGIDRKYAELLTDDGLIKWHNLGQLNAAKADFQKALYYSPDYYENWYYLARINLEMGNPQTAYQNALQLLNIPSVKLNPDVLRLLIKCTLEIGNYQEAMHYCEGYVKVSNAGDVGLVNEILARLKAGENVDELQYQLTL